MYDMDGKYTPLYHLWRRRVSTSPDPRKGVAVRPSSIMPFSDISFLRLSQLNPILLSTNEYEGATEWWASSTTMHET